MTPELRTLDELDVEGERVLLRTDLDVQLTPASSGSSVRVVDDARIRAALPTIDELRRRGARLLLVSHLSDPRAPDREWSMRPVAERLAKLTGAPVPLAPAVVGPQVHELTQRLAPGAMLMLENVRFEAGEKHNDPQLASALAELADLYVNDAFASAHHAHASVQGVARRLPGAAGRLMEREIHALSAITEQPVRPLVAVLGGAKAGEKSGVIRRLLELADTVCLGGATCFPFLSAFGHSVGRSHCAREDLEPAREALLATAGSGRLELPSDLVLARWSEGQGTAVRVLEGVDVPDQWMALDVGPRTADRYVSEIEAAATVFWTGPMGRFERPRFAGATRRIAEAVASTSATTVVVGGGTDLALRSFGLQDRVSHLSTGGGATLAFLEGRKLPGIQGLLRKPVLVA